MRLSGVPRTCCLDRAIRISVSPLIEHPNISQERKREEMTGGVNVVSVGRSSYDSTEDDNGLECSKGRGASEQEDLVFVVSKGEFGRDMFLRIAL